MPVSVHWTLLLGAASARPGRAPQGQAVPHPAQGLVPRRLGINLFNQTEYVDSMHSSEASIVNK